eukprot:857605-Prorocentrum_minimum.AAC.1
MVMCFLPGVLLQARAGADRCEMLMLALLKSGLEGGALTLSRRGAPPPGGGQDGKGQDGAEVTVDWALALAGEARFRL